MSREFNNIHDLGTWVEAHVEDKDTYAEVREAVFWFIINTYDTKDVASMLLEGTPTIRNNQEYVDNYLDTLYDDLDEEEIEEANELLITNLKAHFGLNN